MLQKGQASEVTARAGDSDVNAIAASAKNTRAERRRQTAIIKSPRKRAGGRIVKQTWLAISIHYAVVNNRLASRESVSTGARGRESFDFSKS
jgi:hypothetical protein